MEKDLKEKDYIKQRIYEIAAKKNRVFSVIQKEEECTNE